jgi:hypothetical protein
MRTTITLDEPLLEQLEACAQATNRFELVTFGRGGHFSRQNVDKTSRLVEDDDVTCYADRR